MTRFLKGNDAVEDRRKINRWLRQLNICKKNSDFYELSEEQLNQFENNMNGLIKQYKQIYGR